MPAPGQILMERYRIGARLGTGGFGAVYRAWDLRLEVAVAVKENLSPTDEARRQFQREARILAKLTHPNLPRVSDHFSIPGQGDYLVMDFVEGEDLASILADRAHPVGEAQAADWTAQICDALSYLHAQTPPVIHRDIKPANIKIRPDGRAMLVDFGIAKVYETQQFTKTGARGYTPGYAPVEQYAVGATEPRSDIYALGATLYHLLTQTQPVESIRRIRQDELKRPREINPAISSAIEAVVLRAMAVDADRRFQSAQEFKTALVRLPPQPAKLPHPAVTPPTIVAPQPKSGDPARSNPPSPARIAGITGLASAAALIGLSAVALIGFMLVRWVRGGILAGENQATPAALAALPIATTDLPRIVTDLPTFAMPATDIPPTFTPVPVGEPIKIGAIGELSGDVSPIGEVFKQAAVMAVAEINAAGGLLIGGTKHPVELILEDNANGEAQSIAAARKLITQDQVTAIVGPNLNGPAAAAGEIAESAGVVLISPWANDIELTYDVDTRSNRRYVFRCGMIESYEGQIAAKFAHQALRARTAAVLYNDDFSYSRSIAEGFKLTFEAAGGRIAGYQKYSDSEDDFLTLLVDISKMNPDVLFLPNLDDDQIEQQIRAARALGIKGALLGPGLSVGHKVIEKCAGVCEGFLRIDAFAEDNPAPATQKFVAAFRDRNRYTPTEIGALTYDAFGLLWQALQAAGRVDRRAVRDALARTADYPGVTGRITFSDGSGDPIKSAPVVQLKGNEFVYYATVEP